MTTSYGRKSSGYYRRHRAYLFGQLNVIDMITHRLPLEKTSEGFSLVAEAGDSMKVVIEPQK